MATYGTLNEIDSMANVSGLHGSFAEGMSKEDAQKYLDFLENGSKEGLIEAEIRGIGKVDEALALKKVNPEELLELRKQQLGNVGESGSSTKLYSPVEYKGSVKVNGEVRDVSRRVYQRNDIDINYYDEVTGLTNLERMQAGNPQSAQMVNKFNYIIFCREKQDQWLKLERLHIKGIIHNYMD